MRYSVRSFSRLLPVVALLGVTAAANAQTVPAPFDYAGLATGAKGELVTSLGSAAPIAFGVMALFLGVGVAWKMIKKAAKS